MGRTPATAALLAALALAAPAAATAAKGDPQVRHTAAGMAQARSALLAAADLGAGWTAAPATAAPNPANCKAAPSDQSDLVQTGLTARSFAQGRDRQAVEAVRVYKTPTQAAMAWERTVTVGLLLCDEQRLQQSNTHVKVTGQFRIPLGRIAPRTAGFRITAVARGENGKTVTARLYVDLLLVGRGNTISSAVLSAAGKPFDREFEAEVARDLARRLGVRPTA